MILDAKWRLEFTQHILPRLAVAHVDLTRIAGILRDPGNDVWTESPTDPNVLSAGVGHFSLEGWRVNYRREFEQLRAWNILHSAKLQGYDAQARTALDGYLASIPQIGTAFGAVRAAYVVGGNLVQQRVTQADRDTLAASIEAELQ